MADGDGRGNGESESTRDGNNRRQLRALETRGQPQQQVRTRLHHRAGVQEGGNRRRRHHRPEQPALERHLGRFGQSSQGNQSQRQQRGGLHHPAEGTVPPVVRRSGGAEAQAKTTKHIDHQRPGRILAGNRRALMADQEERAEGRALPEDREPLQIVSQHQTVHQPEESGQEKEESAGRSAGFRGVMFMLMHVTNAERHDNRTYDGNDEHQDGGKRIEHERGGGMRRSPVEMLITHQSRLHHPHHGHRPNFEPEPDANHHGDHGDFRHAAQVAEPSPRRELKWPLGGQGQSRQSRQAGGGDDEHVPDTFILCQPSEQTE